MLEAVGNLLSIAWFVIAIMVIVYWLKSRKVKKQNPKNYRTLNRENGNHDKLKKSIIAMIVTFILASICLAPSENRQEAKEHKTAVAKKKENNKKKAAEDKKKAEDKKMDDEVKKARAKNDKKNFVAYKKALKSVPKDTQNAITSAYVDDNGFTVAVLNDAALNTSDNQLKNISRSAYNAMTDIVNHFKPFSDDDNSAEVIYIKDSSGNTIAKTSWGGFKFIGEE